MKKTSTNDIEYQLTPRCEFHVSDEFVNRVLDSAAGENGISTDKVHRFRWKTLFASVATAAAAVALLLLVRPGSIPASAAEKIFAGAADFFSLIKDYSVEFEVRTLPRENFTYSNPLKQFISHKMNISSDGRWRLDKGGRVAEYDGTCIYMWFPDSNWGWQFDSDGIDAIYPFDVFLDPGRIMHWLEIFVAGLKDSDCHRIEDERTIKLIIKAPAQGDYENDYLKYSSVVDCNTRQTYIFNKADGRLLSAEIEARYLCFYRTLFKVKSFDYNVHFTESAFVIPTDFEWIDERDETVARLEKELPISEFVGISAEEAVEKLADAFRIWDEPMLKVILYDTPLKKLETYGFKGCSLFRKGKIFKSGTYPGVFVPCEIEYSNGEKRKITIALRNDTRWNSWKIDGGI